MTSSPIEIWLLVLSAETLLQSPDSLLTRRPAKVTDAPEQLSEDRRLLLGESRFEVLQHFLRAGLSVHMRLERYEVAQIRQQLIVLGVRRREGARALCCRLILVLFSLFGGHTEVVPDLHLGQEGGRGEGGGGRVTFRPLPTEKGSGTRFLRAGLYDSSILKKHTGTMTHRRVTSSTV